MFYHALTLKELGVYGSPANYTLAMISWLPFGFDYTAYRVALEDVNANPDILPNTVLDYTYVFHNLDAAVSIFFLKGIFFNFFLTGCC